MDGASRVGVDDFFVVGGWQSRVVLGKQELAELKRSKIQGLRIFDAGLVFMLP